MKNFFLIFLIFFSLVLNPALAKKTNPVLILSLNNPSELRENEIIRESDVFKVNEKIYFSIFNPEGFKSNYIKYQIIKQDDNAHIQGFTRIRNITKRIKDKNFYSDYFIISQSGKYYIQIFDITNLHQWLAIGAFRVVEE